MEKEYNRERGNERGKIEKLEGKSEEQRKCRERKRSHEVDFVFLSNCAGNNDRAQGGYITTQSKPHSEYRHGAIQHTRVIKCS